MQATGIPPHVTLLSDMKNIADQLEKNLEKQSENVQRIIEGVMKELEARAVGLGTVTQSGLKESLMHCLEEAGVMRVVRQMETPSSSTLVRELAQPNSSLRAYTQYMWGGKFHSFPEGFCLPKCSILEAWRLWCLGDERLNYPPFRSLRPDDFSLKNARKRLSDYKFVMNKLEQKAAELQLSTEASTEEEILAVFESCRGAISVTPETLTGKRRRTGQLTWLTVVDFLRSNQKHATDSATLTPN
jgi:hypothetical protein